MGSYGASSGADRSAAVSEVSGSKEASSTASSTRSVASGGAKGPCRISATAAATGTEGVGATEAATAGATESESGPWALAESRLAGGPSEAESAGTGASASSLTREIRPRGREVERFGKGARSHAPF
ncbi:hypothetical protein V6N13_016187 [Hibiscus sabdariffa]